MDARATLLTALAAAPRQFDRLLQLHTGLGRDVLVAESLHGVESVDDGGYRLQLDALSVDAHLPLDELLGQPVLLELLTAESASQRRPFHGHVTACERVGSNGGIARYRLVIEPWLAFLRERVDSYVFHDMSVLEIAEDLFADYARAGALAPAWRWELSDRSVYRTRSLTTQYHESDFHFLQRLLAEEGIAYWFEHTGDTAGETLGSHTLVLGDHPEAFADAGSVRFHRADATERADSIQQWANTRRWQTASISRASWDYRSRTLRPASGQSVLAGSDVTTGDIDTSGPYGVADEAHAALRASRQMEAHDVTGRTIQAAGTWRRQAPGTRFSLSQHPDTNGQSYTCLRVEHAARNNLGAEVFEVLDQTLGLTDIGALPLPTALSPGSDPVNAMAAAPSTDFYRNTLTAIPADLPYRPRTVDGHGLRLHPKPTVRGTQTAIVVTDGAPLQTDRDHRIKIQFPWQRGSNASSGMAHPDGDDNAPGTEAAWTWVRVATPWAGDNWGSVMLPRKGQEVVVAFMEGDIDRPVIVGSLYNGAGQPDAPHNQVSGGKAGATGNAPAWFDGNEHPAVFTGFKSQALGASQTGSGGYQQLRLDDTPGQGRAQVATTQHATTLTLGHLKSGQDNVRGHERGFGVELSTQASGALRAGAGLLLSTEPGRQQMAAEDLRSQLTSSAELVQSLADTAKAQLADLPDEADTVPALQALQQVQETLTGTLTGTPAGDGVSGGDGEAPSWNAPLLAASSPDGIIATTPADQIWVSGTETTLTAGNDLNWLSQGETVVAVADGISLYSHGTPAPDSKPQTSTGIALHAAQGDVSARSHQNVATAAAKTSVTIASTEANVEIASPSKHVLATAAGAYLKLEGADIELGAPGTIEFKAAKKEWTTPMSIQPEIPYLPVHANLGNWIEIEHRDWDYEPFASQAYKIFFEGGEVIGGKLDAQGFAEHTNVPKKAIRVEYDFPEPLEDKPWDAVDRLIAAARSKLG